MPQTQQMRHVCFEVEAESKLICSIISKHSVFVVDYFLFFSCQFESEDLNKMEIVCYVCVNLSLLN